MRYVTFVFVMLLLHASVPMAQNAPPTSIGLAEGNPSTVDCPAGQSGLQLPVASVDNPGQSAQAASPVAANKLPRTNGEKVVVAIYEFRSSVGEVAARGATDMFVF